MYKQIYYIFAATAFSVSTSFGDAPSPDLAKTVLNTLKARNGLGYADCIMNASMSEDGTSVSIYGSENEATYTKQSDVFSVTINSIQEKSDLYENDSYFYFDSYQEGSDIGPVREMSFSFSLDGKSIGTINFNKHYSISFGPDLPEIYNFECQ